MKSFIITLLIAFIFAVIWTTPAEAKEDYSVAETPMLSLSDQDRIARDWAFSKVNQFCDHLSAGTAPSELGFTTTPSTRILSNREMRLAECCFVSAKQVCNFLLQSASSNPTLVRRDDVKPAILYPPPITPPLPPTIIIPPPSLFPPPSIIIPFPPPSLPFPHPHPGPSI